MKKICFMSVAAAVAIFSSGKVFADDQAAPDTRYGLFNGLDQRSSYGQNVFPEPFLIDDSALERAELRLDWRHTASGSDHGDNAKAEIEYGVGLTTLELALPYERSVTGGQTAQGMANIEVAARRPFYQFVSRHGCFDTTFGAALELGIPTGSDVSKNTELVPKIFNDTKIGNFTVQTVLGDSMLFGPGSDGGVNTFEYGFTFGYDITHKTLLLPGIEKIIPVAELSGETQLNKADAGHNRLLAGVGLRANLKPIGRIQPRPGILFVFPVDNGARADAHWGIMTSLVFEF